MPQPPHRLPQQPRDDRVAIFLEARGLYLQYLERIATAFDELNTEHHTSAAADMSLQRAERGYRRAVDLAREARAFEDVGTGLYQLGMLLHLQGRFAEAESTMREALDFLGSVIALKAEHRAVTSGCCYHLGLLAQRRSDWTTARTYLERSLGIDLLEGDAAGEAVVRRALAGCPPVALQDRSDENGRTDSPEPVLSETSPPGPRIALDWPDVFDTYSGAVDHDVVWVVSYSPYAAAGLLTRLDEQRGHLPRRLVVSHLSFVDETGIPTPPALPAGARLSAAVLVLERESLQHVGFRYWAEWCLTSAARRPGFRVFVQFHNLSREDLQARADAYDPLVLDLYDAVQLNPSQSPQQCAENVIGFLAIVDQVRAAAAWRRTRTAAAIAAARLATFVQYASGALSAILIAATVVPSLRQSALELALSIKCGVGVVCGVVVFPAASRAIHLAGQGFREARARLQADARLRRWTYAGFTLAYAAGAVPLGIGTPWQWLVLGVVAGILLDVVRRAGACARRGRVSLDRLATDAGDGSLAPELFETQATATPDVWTCQFIAPLKPRVFVSYTRSSPWSEAVASRLNNALDDSGADTFLDRVTIEEGASWRQQIQLHLAESNVFVSVLDERSLRRPWVAAECAAALTGRIATGSPQIVLLVKQGLERYATRGFAIFRHLLRVKDLPPGIARPRVVVVGPNTVPVVTASVLQQAHHAFALIPLPIARVGLRLSTPLVALGTVGSFAGLPVGIFGLLQHWHKFDTLRYFDAWGLRVPVVLAIAYWLGFVARLGVASRYEVESEAPAVLSAIQILAAVGLALGIHAWLPGTTALTSGWVLTLAVLGWQLAAYFVGTVEPTRRSRRRGQRPPA